MGVEPTRIVRLRVGCPSTVASLALLNLVDVIGVEPTRHRVRTDGSIITLSYTSITTVVQVVGVEPTRIVRLKAGCTSTVASLALKEDPTD